MIARNRRISTPPAAFARARSPTTRATPMAKPLPRVIQPSSDGPCSSAGWAAFVTRDPASAGRTRAQARSRRGGPSMKGPRACVTSTPRDPPRTLRMPDGTRRRGPKRPVRPRTPVASHNSPLVSLDWRRPQDQRGRRSDDRPETADDGRRPRRVAPGRADRRGRQARPDRGRGRRVGSRGGRAGGPCHRRGRARWPSRPPAWPRSPRPRPPRRRSWSCRWRGPGSRTRRRKPRWRTSTRSMPTSATGRPSSARPTVRRDKV